MKSSPKKSTCEFKPLEEKDFRTALSLWCANLDRQKKGQRHWAKVLRTCRILGIYNEDKLGGVAVFAPTVGIEAPCESVHIVVSSRLRKRWLNKRLLRWMRGYLDSRHQDFITAIHLSNVRAMRLVIMLGFNPVEEHVPEEGMKMYHRGPK